MFLDALVKQRLRDRRIVHFAVAVAAVADDVHDDLAAEFRAKLRGDLADAHHRVRVFRVDVKDGYGLAFGNVRSEARRVLLDRKGREPDQIIHDDVNCSADGVSLQVSQIQRLRPDALPGKRRVSMHDDGNNFVESFRRAVDISAAQAIAGLLRAGPSHGHRIDGLEMARIRNQVHADLFAARRDVRAGCADVVFHVARAQHAARINILKTGDNFMGRLARRVNHYVQPPAVAHGHDRRDRPVLRRRVQHRVQQRNQRGNAFQGKSLRAQVPRLQNLLEKVGADQPLQNPFLIDFARWPFDALRDPAPPLWIWQVHEFSPDRAAINAARLVSRLTGQPI